MRLRLVLGLLLVAAVGACGMVSRQDVPGVYQLNQGKTKDVIVLRPDGTWIHSVTPPGRPTERESGRWEWEQEDGTPVVTFRGFQHLWRRELAPNSPVVKGIWSVGVQRTPLGEIVLPVDDDIALAYRRISSGP
jgi:hypothetical protein